MTPTELDKADLLIAGIGQHVPWAFYNVSQTQLSIARHYGRISCQGEAYRYFPEDDSLVRADVVDWLTKRDGLAAHKANEAEKARWAEVQGVLL